MTRPAIICHCDTCTDCVPAPRASRMPEHMASLDPSFVAALRDPVPEEAINEKEGKR